MSRERSRLLYACTNHAWGYGWTYYQMLAVALARTRDVVYVDSPVSLARVRSSELGLLRGAAVREERPGLRVLRSATFPLQRGHRPRRFALELLAGQTARWAARAGFEPEVVWCYIPEEITFVRRFPRARSYHWIADHEASIPGEEELFAAVDVILCGADPVFDRLRSRFGQKAQYFPVACDFERYNAELRSKREVPGLSGARRPVVGYAGLVGSRVDVDLLVETARRPEVGTVAVAGPLRDLSAEAVGRLAGEPNVVLLGPQQAELVPAVISAFDVGLIPYVDDAFNRNCNPVKFYEYLALGKPVVTTQIPTLGAFSAVASVGPRDSFVERVCEALDAPPGDLMSRVEVARAHSFEAAVARFNEIDESVAAGRAGTE